MDSRDTGEANWQDLQLTDDVRTQESEKSKGVRERNL